MFGPRFARHRAGRYEKRGLDRTASRMVALLEERGVQKCTVLEIGGGVGEIQLELLRRGATRATNLELSAAYDDDAVRLTEQAGMADRVERRVLDIAADPDGVEQADIVVLHRVVCCYPDYQRLLGAAAAHAREILVFSYPPRSTLSRTAFGAQNALFRLVGREFRVFTHPPKEMIAAAEASGMRVLRRQTGWWWRIVALGR
jgi:2-polyprenyl-3-methyl-5-hydroxy-6-metoxy-1,4-benzoquinol methylase